MDFVQAVAAIFLFLAFITDVRSQIIPNRLSLLFFTAAFVYHICLQGIGAGFIHVVSGTFAGFLPLLLLHLAKGIGAGDVKLFGALGAWIGVWTVLQVMLYAILYAGLIGLFLLVYQRSFGRRVVSEVSAMLIPDAGWRKHQWLQWGESGKKFPFMLAVAPAAITVWSMIN